MGTNTLCWPIQRKFKSDILNKRYLFGPIVRIDQSKINISIGDNSGQLGPMRPIMYDLVG